MHRFAFHRLAAILGSRPLWIGLLLLQSALVMVASAPWVGGDSASYFALAQSVRRGCYGTLVAGLCHPDALRPPGYPLVLATLSGLPQWLAIALHLAAFIGALLLVDRSLVARPGARLAFRWLALLYPFGALYSASFQTEAIAALLVTSAALLVARTPSSWRPLFHSGLLLGAAAMVRTDLLLLPFVAAAVVFLVSRSARLAILPLATAAAVLTPYAVWNSRQFDRFTPAPIASAVGNSLYLATWQPQLDPQDLNSLYSAHPSPAAVNSGLTAEVARLNRSFGASANVSPFNPISYPTAALQAQSSRTFGAAAIDRIATNPGPYATHVANNVWALWNSSRYPLPAYAASFLMLISSAVTLLGAAGIAIAWRRNACEQRLIPFLLYPMIVHLPLHTEARYTASVRPLLLLFAAIALAALWSRLGGDRLHHREVERQRIA